MQDTTTHETVTHRRFPTWQGEYDPDTSGHGKAPKGHIRYRTTGDAVEDWNMHVFWPAREVVPVCDDHQHKIELAFSSR